MESPLYLFKNSFLKVLGYTCIVIVFGLCVFDIIIRLGSIKASGWWRWFFGFFSYSLVMLARNPTSNGIYSFFLQNGLLLFMCLLSSISLEPGGIKRLFRVNRILLFVLLIPASIVAIGGTRRAFAMFNPYFSPILYKLILPLSFFVVAKVKRKPIALLFFATLLVRMVERATAGALLVTCIIYIILGWTKDHRWFLRVLFPMVFVMLGVFVFLYVVIEQHPLGHWLNHIFRVYTGGYFYSGRHRLWLITFEYIKRSPLWGYGFDSRILQNHAISLSMHNTYIYLAVQGGLVGLMLFYMFLNSIWLEYRKRLDDDIVRLAAAYLIGIMVFINFEVTLFSNSVVTSIYSWMVISIGLVQSQLKQPQSYHNEVC